jgi:hypothetical protein
MKPTQILSIALSAALLPACATSSATKQGGAINPNVNDVNAHIELGRRTSASAEISTFQIFGLKFHSDASGKRFSGLRSNLVVPGYAATPSTNSALPGISLVEGAVGQVGSIAADPLHFLFGSPASRESALSAARHDAVEKSDADGIIETKAKVETTGFSLLGLIGWGTATANVEGQGVKIAPGALNKGRVVIEKQ